MIVHVPYKNNIAIEVKQLSNFFVNRESKSKAFFGILNDSGTVMSFLDAVINNDLEDAKVYISKDFVNTIDLDAVKEVFAKGEIYKCAAKNEYKKTPTNFKTNSVLVMENGVSRVLHLHLIQEPDIHGNWKIFGIDKEQ